MAIFNSGNPAFREKTFENSLVLNQSEVMTERGTLNKFLLLCFVVISSAFLIWIGALGGFVVALVTIFKPVWASFTAPVYALLEGVFVGGISAFYSHAFERVAPGIVMQSVGLTFGTVLAMFVLYRTGVIKVTERFRSIIYTATMGIAIFYLLAMGLHLFHVDIPFLHEGSMMGIIFSLVVVGIAAMRLLLDFDNIETGVKMGAPKYMEWYGAFGLVVTIVWLYLEILRLLSKLNSRN